MSKLRKPSAFIICVMLVGTILCSCAVKDASQPPANPTSAVQQTPSVSNGDNENTQVIKIGFFGPMSGGSAESGRQGYVATKAAVDYVNENGGIKSLNGAKLELVIIDHTSDVSQGTLPLERELDKHEIVAIVGSSISGQTLNALPILQKYQIPAVTGSAANSSITKQGCNFVFQPATKSNQNSAMQLELVGYIAQKLGIQNSTDLKCAIVFENSPANEESAKATQQLLEEQGYTVAALEAYNSNNFTDAAPLVTKLKNAQVDVVFSSALPTDAKLILTAMHTLDYKPIIISAGGAMCWPAMVNDLGADLLQGILISCAFNFDQKPAVENANFNAFLQKYEQDNKEFISDQGALSSISLMIIAQAIEDAKSTDPVAIRDAIYNVSSENNPWLACANRTDPSQPLTFDENGFIANTAPTVVQWIDGKTRTVYPESIATAYKMINPATGNAF